MTVVWSVGCVAALTRASIGGLRHNARHNSCLWFAPGRARATAPPLREHSFASRGSPVRSRSRPPLLLGKLQVGSRRRLRCYRRVTVRVKLELIGDRSATQHLPVLCWKQHLGAKEFCLPHVRFAIGTVPDGENYNCPRLRRCLVKDM